MALVLAGCYSADTPLVQACEVALKKRLLAPATYRRVGVVESQSAMPLEEYLTNERSDSIKDFYRKLGKQPVRARAIIEYDAANAFGTPLRSFADCTYEASSADAVSGVSEHSVKIGGKTTTDHLIDAVKRAR